MVGALKLVVTLALIAGALVVVWSILFSIGLPLVPAPPIDVKHYL